MDLLSGLVQLLANMASLLEVTLAVGILLASFQVYDLTPVTASIKTLSDKDLNCDDFSARLI